MAYQEKQSTRSGYFYHYNREFQKLTYIHRKIAETKIGRTLFDGEVVHHIDGNKENNDPDNLMVFKSNGDHVRFHNLSPSTREIFLLSDGSYICRVKPSKPCPICGVLFNPSHVGTKREQRYCSHSCAAKSSKTKKIEAKKTRAEIHKQIWNKPMVEIAKDFGVSDTAIKKICIKNDIPRPGRGFWQKIRLNIFEGQSCPLPKEDSE